MAPHAPEPAAAAPAVEAGMKRPPSPPPRDAFGVEVAEKGAGEEEEVRREPPPLRFWRVAMTGPPPAPGLPDPHGRRQTDSDLYPPPTLAALPVAQAEVASRGGGLGERVAATTAAFFEAVGVRVGTRPWLTIGLAFLVVLAGASGISQMDMEGRQENLWVPKETQAQWDKVSPRVAVGRRARPC